MNRRGKFIVIEGSDGSGKSTQLGLLSDYFKQQGHSVTTRHFPRYEEESSYFVRKYLAGDYGAAENLGAYGPSLFYALDRFDAAKDMRNDLADGKIVLCDRFVGSNLAHQGQKIDDPQKRKTYYEWLLNLEFNMLGIPVPDLSVVLHVPAEIAQKMANTRYTDQSRDIHEANLEHLKKAVIIYQELCQEFPDKFVLVDCMRDETLLDITDVTQAILAKIKYL